MWLHRSLWVAWALAALLVTRAHRASADEGASRGLEPFQIEAIERSPHKIRNLLQFAPAGFNQQGNYAQAGGYSGQAGSYYDQPGAYNGQGSGYNGQANGYYGQTGAFNGQRVAYNGQTGAYNGQGVAYSGQAGGFNGQPGAFGVQAGAYNGQSGGFNGQAGGLAGQADPFIGAGQVGGYPAQPGAFPGFIEEQPAEPPTLLDRLQQRIAEYRETPRAPLGDRLANFARGVGSVVSVAADVADIVEDLADK